MTDLAHGSKGPEVGNWQRFLNEARMTDPEGKPLVDDEDFGRKTLYATKLYQRQEHLPESGTLDAVTRKRAVSQGFIAFVAAKHFQRSLHARPIRLIVLHTAECSEIPTAAENVANYFRNPMRKTADGRLVPVIASAHYCVDEDSVVQCVRDRDIAWHAGPVNTHSLGIEHAGFARQTAAEWHDSASRAILWRSAELVASLMRRYGIELTRPTPKEIRGGNARGIVGHVEVNEAFGVKGHWDPGPSFPYAHYLALVKASL